MAVSVHAERERKYDVDAHVEPPGRDVLAQLPGVAVVEGPGEERLEATYHDTCGLDLTAHQITLRRRTGGHDAGWTLKLPVSAEERQEAEPRSWREWEVELTGDGGPELWDALDEAVTATGATRSSSGSKLARSLGDGAPVRTPTPTLSPRSPAGEVLRLALATQVEALKTQDAGVRRGTRESVHQMRIASRRLRSTLATYRPLLLDPGPAQAVRDELQWLGLGLNTARDIQVMQARLAHLLDQEPDPLVVGPVRDRIEADLDERYAAGMREGLSLLDEERYFRLLDSLDAIVAVPLTDRAGKPAGKVIGALLERSRRRLRRAAKRAARAGDPQQRDLALHDVRKAAKRLRYAAETARPALGRPVKKLARRAKALQDVLGEHQDGVVCRELLLDLAERATARGESAFTYGRLHAREEATAATQDTAYRKALAKLSGAARPRRATGPGTGIPRSG